MASGLIGLAVAGGKARCRAGLGRLGVSEGVLRVDFDMQTDLEELGLVLFNYFCPEVVGP